MKCKNLIRDFFIKLDSEINKIPTNEEIDVLEKRKVYFSSFFYSYVILSIGLAFFSQPLLKFADPLLLFLDGFVILFGLVCIYRAGVTSAANPNINKKMMFILFTLCILSGLILTSILFNDGIENSIRHDLYCSNLQGLILNNVDAEKNSAIFNNMYCRIQYSNTLLNIKSI